MDLSVLGLRSGITDNLMQIGLVETLCKKNLVKSLSLNETRQLDEAMSFVILIVPNIMPSKTT